MGLAELLGGVVFALVALGVAGPVAAAVGLMVTGALFGTCMYLLAYRRFVRRAVEEPASPPTANREPAARTRRRVALTTSALLVPLAGVAAISGTPALVGGIVAGNGAALLLTSRWLRAWEQEHRSQVLREPRWRWSRKGRRGWGRGRGTIDPQDFYVVPSTRETPDASPAV